MQGVNKISALESGLREGFAKYVTMFIFVWYLNYNMNHNQKNVNGDCVYQSKIIFPKSVEYEL